MRHLLIDFCDRIHLLYVRRGMGMVMGMGMEYGKDKGNKGYGIWWYGKNRVGYMN